MRKGFQNIFKGSGIWLCCKKCVQSIDVMHTGKHLAKGQYENESVVELLHSLLFMWTDVDCLFSQEIKNKFNHCHKNPLHTLTCAIAHI